MEEVQQRGILESKLHSASQALFVLTGFRKPKTPFGYNWYPTYHVGPGFLLWILCFLDFIHHLTIKLPL